MKRNKVLIIEDNASERYLLRPYLETEGLVVLEAETASESMRVLKTDRPDILLLDLNLPDEDGLALLRKIRAISEIPVIAVSSRNSDLDRITGLEIGADDYLSKPYHPRELILRLDKLLKRSPKEKRDNIYQFQGLSLDPNNRTLLDREGCEIALTYGEFNILNALAKSRGSILSRDQLLDAVASTNESSGLRSVDVLVSRIRQKIELDPKEPKIVRTEKGCGYRLVL